MFDYLIRRALLGLLTLLLITFIVYALIRHMPGSPLTTRIAEQDPSKKISAADMERWKALYGLDKPWYEAYFIWLKNTLRGDLGSSISQHRLVSTMLKERIGPTLLLSITATIFGYLIAIPTGLYMTARNGKLDERIISTLFYGMYALPTFVAALTLLYFFYQRLDWLPLRGIISENHASLSPVGKVLDIAWHMILPVICFGYHLLAYDARFIRANMQEVVRQDYIRTARAKGVSPRRVLTVHAFRNTLIPLVTQLGLTLPGLVSGAVIIEQIFNWPGMGQMLIEAIGQRDAPVVMALTLIFSVATLAGQLLADVLYSVVDPRVKYS